MEVSGFFLTFAIAKRNRAIRSGGGVRRPSNDSGHFLCSLTLSRTHAPHYTNSGGHPVDISPRTKSITFSDREGCRFLCLIGEGAPRREAGENKREVRKDPRSKAWPAFLSWGECSDREAELEEEP